MGAVIVAIWIISCCSSKEAKTLYTITEHLLDVLNFDAWRGPAGIFAFICNTGNGFCCNVCSQLRSLGTIILPIILRVILLFMLLFSIQENIILIKE